MTVIVYHGPGHVLSVDGKRIPRDTPTEVVNATAERLLADTHVNVSVLHARGGSAPKPRPKSKPKPKTRRRK